MVALFLLAELFDVPLLTEPEPLRSGSGALAAFTGVALLVVDVVLPVPSSVVMVAHGALFGIVAGAALSMAGSLAAFAVAFALGRRGAGAVARVVHDEDRRRADLLLCDWGLVAIVLTRPIPMLAEMVGFAAGASALRWRAAFAAAALGCLPASVLYAIAGAAATRVAGGALVFAAVAVLALVAGAVARPRRRVLPQESRP